METDSRKKKKVNVCLDIDRPFHGRLGLEIGPVIEHYISTTFLDLNYVPRLRCRAMKSLSKKQIAGIIFAVLLSQIFVYREELFPYRWQIFNSPDGKFSINLPGKPIVEEDQQISVAGGDVATTHGVSTQANDHVVYNCTYVEYPSLITKSPDEVLTNARDGGLKNVQGTLISEKRTTVDGHPARDIQARARENSAYDTRLILVGKRMYMLMVVDTGKPSRDGKNIQKFFDSFKTSAN